MKYRKGLMAILIIVLLLIIDVSVSVSGNSALLEDYQPPAFNLIPVDNTDIYVKHEDLLFDFSESIMDGYLVQDGRVTATYDMGNPGETKKVKMGFPFFINYVSHTNVLTDVSVTANSQVIEPKLYFKDHKIIPKIEDYSFEDALADLVPEDYRFEEDRKLKFFSIDSSEPEYQLSIVCKSGSKVYYNNLVLGESQSLLGYTSYYFSKRFIDSKNTWIFCSDIDSVITDEEVDYTEDLITYNDLLDRIVENEFDSDENLDLRNYALLKLVIKGYIEETSPSVISFSDLLHTYLYNIIVVMVYEVELIGNDASNIISISYSSQPSFNMRYEPAIYKTVYITNPAKNWASFNTLDIKIIPPADNSFVVEANLEYIREVDGNYTLSMDGLPDENIVFSFSSSKNPVKSSQSSNYFLLYIFYCFPIILLLIIVLVIVFVIIGIRKKKKTGNKKLLEEGEYEI